MRLRSSNLGALREVMVLPVKKKCTHHISELPKYNKLNHKSNVTIHLYVKKIVSYEFRCVIHAVNMPHFIPCSVSHRQFLCLKCTVFLVTNKTFLLHFFREFSFLKSSYFNIKSPYSARKWSRVHPSSKAMKINSAHP